jgi:hypothetical protein
MKGRYGGRQLALAEFMMLALKSCRAHPLFDFPLEFGPSMTVSVLGCPSLSVKSKVCGV